MAVIGFGAMARQFPGLVRQAVRLGWEASRWDTFATIAANLASGVFTGFALLASTSVLEALFAAGPTPGRVRAALPALALVAAAVAARSGLQAAAGWSQGRLEPQIDRVVETRLFELTARVQLSAFDGGRVTEQGTHADLMALGGRYAELYTLQASQYDTSQPGEAPG